MIVVIEKEDSNRAYSSWDQNSQTIERRIGFRCHATCPFNF